MYKIWIGLAFVAIITTPAPAQDYRKNWHECAKETGMPRDIGYTPKLQDGRIAGAYRANGQAQQMAFYDCLSRKASLAPEPSPKGQPRVSAVATSVSAQPGRFAQECGSIKEIGAQIELVKARRDRIAIGNKARWCPLKKEQINYNERMIRIFDRDPEKCGVRGEVVDRLKAATESLRASTQDACGA